MGLLLHANAIEHGTPKQFEKVADFSDRITFISPLEKMTDRSVFAIHRMSVDPVQLSPTFGQIRDRGLQPYIEMIGHQAIGMNDPIEAFANLGRNPAEDTAVVVETA